MLNGKDVSKYDNGTSAESTIFRAVMIHTQSDENMRRVRAELEQFFASCVNQKKSFDIIITRLTRAPYGMRLGVLPFYILDSLLRLENMVKRITNYIVKQADNAASDSKEADVE